MSPTPRRTDSRTQRIGLGRFGARLARGVGVCVAGMAGLVGPTAASAQCGPSTVTVSTTAELRAAVGDACVSLVMVTPGTYDLTASGAGQLAISQNKTLRNVGGGEAIIDAAGASRAVFIAIGVLAELDGLTITGGSAGSGGGVLTRGTTTIRSSTITGNASDDGGGIFHRSGTLLVENSTISGNTANRAGGGLDLRAGATLHHVTVASNSARRGGGIRSRDASVTLTNTIVADNPTTSGQQVRGNSTSQGVNVVEGGCASCLPSDLTVDPALLPLASNGGDTRTHALAPTSVAIDAAAAAFGLGSDQRGVSRPIGSGFDIGAYEAPASFAVTVAAAAAASTHLPSNGTPYVETFTVTNTGLAPSAYVLRATTTGSAVTVDSIRGAGLTFGAAPDSALTGLLAGSGGSVAVSVHHTVLDVAAGTSDPVDLSATHSLVPLVAAADTTTVTVVRPFLGMTKIATVLGDTIPGAPITYQMTVTNLGTEDAAQVELVDSLPAEVDYQLGSTSETLPPGVTATLDFDDGSGSWTYAPISGGCGAAAGFDRCVRAIRWTLNNPLSSIGPNNVAVFRFTAGIL